MKKTIPSRYFSELKENGHTVPRDEQSGEVMTNFLVGKEYIIEDKKTKETIKARCTQSHPHHLKKVD